MDPVTISALILAIVGGVAGEAGGRLWDGLSALVRRPVRRHGAALPSAAESDGLAELEAVKQAPVDASRALRLAEVLVARASGDVGFGAELESWLANANQVRIEAGRVTSTISGGVQHGPVLQGRDFTGLTFTSGPSSQSRE